VSSQICHISIQKILKVSGTNGLSFRPNPEGEQVLYTMGLPESRGVLALRYHWTTPCQRCALFSEGSYEQCQGFNWSRASFVPTLENIVHYHQQSSSVVRGLSSSVWHRTGTTCSGLCTLLQIRQPRAAGGYLTSQRSRRQASHLTY